MNNISEEELSRKNKKSRRKKPERTFLERAIEAIIGAFVIYLSASATDAWQIVFVVLGIVLVIHALASD